MTSKQPLFYKDKPLFGFDIGFKSLKVMQIDASAKVPVISGYGVAEFDPNAIKDGQIIDPEAMAKVALDFFQHKLVGKITTRRVAATIPSARIYSRVMTLPAKLGKKEIEDAMRFEAEQYIPVSVDDLYLDYIINGSRGENNEVLVVAAPRRVVDSYMTFLRLLGLEVCALESTNAASSRLVAKAEGGDQVPTILIDFGSVSCDLTVYDKAIIVSGTVLGGGDQFAQSIADRLGVTLAEAQTIKSKYGLGVSKKQAEIKEALDPVLSELIKEIKRVIRYYEERSGGERKIGQIVTMGGGANMPGLSEYLIEQLRLPVRLCDPWQRLTFEGLTEPVESEKAMYVTVAGAALINPKEIWK